MKAVTIETQPPGGSKTHSRRFVVVLGHGKSDDELIAIAERDVQQVLDKDPQCKGWMITDYYLTDDVVLDVCLFFTPKT